MAVADVSDAGQRFDALCREHFPHLANADPAADILGGGVLASYEVVDLVGWIEEVFGLEIIDEEIAAENFGTKQKLVAFIDAKLSR